MDNLDGLSSAIIFLYDFPQRLIEIINHKVTLAQSIVSPLIYTLLGIEVVMIGIGMSIGSMSNGNAVLLRVFKMVFMFFIITNIHKLGYVLLEGFRYIAFQILDSPLPDGTILGDGTESAYNIFDNPSEMLDRLKKLFVDPLKTELIKVHELTEKTGKFGVNIVQPLMLKIKIFMVSVVYYVVFILFSILFLQLLIAKLEFSVVIFFSVILIPFILNQRLKFLSENVFSAIFGSAIKIGMTYFMMGIVFMVLTTSGEKLFTTNGSTSTGIETIISFLVYIALALYLSFFGPKIAMTLICGKPQLGLAQMLQTAMYSAPPMRIAMNSVGKKIMSNVEDVSKAVRDGADTVKQMRSGTSAIDEKQTRMHNESQRMHKNFDEIYKKQQNTDNSVHNTQKN